MTRAATTGALLLAAALACGCGGDSGNSLSGSIGSSYSLDFTSVRVQKQFIKGKLDAVYVLYVYQPQGAANPRFPVKVIANAPVKVGQKHDLVSDGGVVRVMGDGSVYPDLQEGYILFDALGDEGEDASGEFHVTFDSTPSITTLNGEFSATVERIGT